jgi:hypothetical protein
MQTVVCSPFADNCDANDINSALSSGIRKMRML